MHGLYGVRGFGKRKEAIEIVRSLASHLFRRDSPKLADLPGNFLHECGLIAFAAMWNWCEEGRVGFNQHSVERDLFRGISNLLRFWESDISGKRNHKSHVERAFGMRPSTRETVQNPADSGRLPMLLD